MPFAQKTRVFGTVKFRLATTLGVILAFTVVALIVILNAELAQALRADAERGLVTELHEFRTILEEGGMEALLQEVKFEEASQGKNRVFIRIIDSEKNEISRSDLGNWGVPEPPDGAVPEFADPRVIVGESPVSSTPYLMAFGRIGDSLFALLGTSTEHIDVALASYRSRSIRTGLLAFLVCVVAAWFVARHSMRGIDVLTQSARRVEGETLNRRIDTPGYGEEIDILAGVLNEMLAKIEALMNESKAMNDNIAHELRSPITRIRGVAEMTLTSESTNEAYQNMAAEVVENCDGLLNIVNSMLTISELESGVAHLRAGKLNWSSIVTDTYEWFKPAAEDGGISINSDIENDLFAFGDDSLLRQALANLIDNAIKYTPHGGQVTIRLSRDEEYSKLSVTDSGVGITESDLPHVFDRFYRADETMDKSGNGLGLGLARAIVNAHGGEIHVESNPGSLTIFTIRLKFEGPSLKV